MKTVFYSFFLLVAVAASAAGTSNPTDIKFKLAYERKMVLDGVKLLSSDSYWPGAQYEVTVTGFPAVVKFATAAGEEPFRLELKADDSRLPAPPFDLALLVSGNSPVSVFVRKDGEVKFLALADAKEGSDMRTARYVKELRFRGEGGAANEKVFLSAGIGQADMRFITTGCENRPYRENGRLFFTFSSRAYGSWQSVMSIDPLNPADLRLEGTIFFDYGDGLVRNDISSDIFHDEKSGEWRAYSSNFSTGVGSCGTRKRARGGINVVRCERAPLRDVTIMKSRPLDLPGMNEDPDGIWDAEAGKWRLLLSEFTNGGIKASMWESENWDGPFVRLAPPVKWDSTGTTIFPYEGRRYCLSGSSDRACYVYSYPQLERLGQLDFDIPPWPTDGRGGLHGRVWPAVAAFTDKNGKTAYLMVTMDRVNFPGIPLPNWTYGKIMVYVGSAS